MNEKEQLAWFEKETGKIYDKYVKFDTMLSTREKVSENETVNSEIRSMKKDQKLLCRECGKEYMIEGWLKRHLKSVHGWEITLPPTKASKAEGSNTAQKVPADETSQGSLTQPDVLISSEMTTSRPSEIDMDQSPNINETNKLVESHDSAIRIDVDELAPVRASFLKCALLLYDTNDAYMMGDGNRIFLNAKFEFLLADACGHTGYRRWLWRLLANEMAILSPKKAFEYKWNCTVNTRGGPARNIPNDNLVEIFVGSIKEMIRGLGSNIDFEQIRFCARIILEMKNIVDSVLNESGVETYASGHSEPDKTDEIMKMVTEMQSGDFFVFEKNRKFEGFSNFIDVLSRSNVINIQNIIEKFKVDEKSKNPLV